MKLLRNSLALTLIYTIGHMIIAGTVVYVMTGSTLWEAGLVALIEPCLNGVWFYILHKMWLHFTEEKKYKLNDPIWDKRWTDE